MEYQGTSGSHRRSWIGWSSCGRHNDNRSIGRSCWRSRRSEKESGTRAWYAALELTRARGANWEAGAIDKALHILQDELKAVPEVLLVSDSDGRAMALGWLIRRDDLESLGLPQRWYNRASGSARGGRSGGTDVCNRVGDARAISRERSLPRTPAPGREPEAWWGTLAVG